MLKRTLGSERVVRIGGVTVVAGALCGWACGLLVLLVMSCRVPSKICAGLARSDDTMTSLPSTIIFNVLSARAMILLGTMYGGSKAWCMTSCRINTLVESLMNVAGYYERRAVGVGHS